MPYIHWESVSSQVDIREILDRIKQDISKTRIWRSNEDQPNEDYSRQNSAELNEPSPSPGGDDGAPSARNTKSTDYDAELLKTYLYKRWPVHMRRTLDQYYYSYLADTKTRDSDQVAMRARGRRLQEEAEFSAQFFTTKANKDDKKVKEEEKEKKEKEKEEKKKKEEEERKKREEERKMKKENRAEYEKKKKGEEEKEKEMKEQEEREKEKVEKEQKEKNGLKYPPSLPDKNSPVVMVDQLWLWVVSPGSSSYFIFCHRS